MKFYYSFENERFHNSHYALIKEPRNVKLIKDLPPEEVKPFFHNGALDFLHTRARPSFVNENGAPNEKRFEMPDGYDKSTYLSKNPRTKLNVSFNEQTRREPDHLIEKGGNFMQDLRSTTDTFYEN